MSHSDGTGMFPPLQPSATMKRLGSTFLIAGVDLPDRGDEDANHAVVLFHRPQLARRLVDEVEEELLARDVLVPPRKHRPVHDGGLEAVGIGVDVSGLWIDLRDAVFAGDPVEADHDYETVLAGEGDALVEGLQSRLVDDVAVL